LRFVRITAVRDVGIAYLRPAAPGMMIAAVAGSVSPDAMDVLIVGEIEFE
jgi:hypothetical protein